MHEAIRSTVIISDLFTDKSQFTWMLDVFLELSKLHAVEDELLHQYLIVGICKAVGVLTPVSYEKFHIVIYLAGFFLGFRDLRTGEETAGTVPEESIFILTYSKPLRSSVYTRRM